MTYQEANNLLQGRCKHSRCWWPYTKLVRDGDKIHVRYAGHDIVTMLPDGSVILNSHGMIYPSLRTRMSKCTMGYVGQERGKFYLQKSGTLYSFRDGITIQPDGTVINFDPEPFSDKIKAHNKEIRERNKRVRVDQADFHDGSGYTLYIGDVVRESTNGWQSGKLVSTDTGNTFIIKRIWKNQWTSSVWMRLKCRETGKSEVRRIKSWRWRLKRDEFLSAANKAANGSQA